MSNKIIHRFEFGLINCIVFLLLSINIMAQDGTLNKYGLRVIKTKAALAKTVLQTPAKQMIDVQSQIPSIALDLRYASTNNFMHEQLYPLINTTFLRKSVADSLEVAQKQLIEMGFGLKIFDAYRPYSVTVKMWKPVQDDRYAADPKKGSGHNRGIAVDLTVINLTTKQELDMGTNFDNFSDTAHHAFTNLPEDVLQNRLLLKSIMEHHGFKALDTEWWHYSLANAKDFELLDISFKELESKKTIHK